VETLLAIEALGSDERWLFLSNAPPRTPLEEMVKAASRRHLIEEAFENAKGEAGLGHLAEPATPLASDTNRFGALLRRGGPVHHQHAFGSAELLRHVSLQAVEERQVIPHAHAHEMLQLPAIHAPAPARWAPPPCARSRR
jgi:hypothetical protein